MDDSKESKKMKKKDAIICDVDGTVALMNGKRTPFEYHKADRDDPNQPVIDTVLSLKGGIENGIELIMLSARENVVLNTKSTDNKHNRTYNNPNYVDLYDLTSSWLNKYVNEEILPEEGCEIIINEGCKWNTLLMRPAGDYRKDCYVKYDIYNEYIKHHYNVLMVFDDRNQVVDMWRNGLNLTCFQVADGNF